MAGIGAPYIGCKQCKEKISKHGLCPTCYRAARFDRALRHWLGVPDCEEIGCESILYQKKMCRTHYRKYRDGEDYVVHEKFDPSRVFVGSVGCVFPGCTRPHIKTSGLCRAHRKQAMRYGMDFSELVEVYRDPRCRVCGGPDGLSIDHDHECCPQKYKTCGKCNRGLLCRGCNTAIGSAKDNPQTLRALADYLESGARI